MRISSVLQCVAVRVLQCVAVRVLQCVTVYAHEERVHTDMQCVAVCCSV